MDSRALSAKRIIRALERPASHKLEIKRHLTRNAPVTELVSALRQSDAQLTRTMLCEILGRRKARSAIPYLLQCLNDDSVMLRAEAANAMAKIGVPAAGPELLARLAIELDPGVRQALAIALGAIRYQPSIPHLAKLLGDAHPMTRASAAWSLGELMASETEAELRQALKQEVADSARERMQEALDRLDQQRRLG